MIADFSRIRGFIGDSKEDGPDTVLIFQGFSGADEIQLFFDALYERGILKPPAEQPSN